MQNYTTILCIFMVEVPVVQAEDRQTLVSNKKPSIYFVQGISKEIYNFN